MACTDITIRINADRDAGSPKPGEKHDLWDVNTERSYYEEFTQSRQICPIDLIAK